MIRVQKILSTILNVNASVLTDDASPATIPAWDSFNALMIVSELEREFAISFSIDEITTVKNVGDIRKRLEAHGVHLYGE